MEQIEGAIIYADEPQLWTSIYDHKSNSIIAKTCSLARQRDNKLIISSSDTRVFTKHNEAYFDFRIGEGGCQVSCVMYCGIIEGWQACHLEEAADPGLAKGPAACGCTRA